VPQLQEELVMTSPLLPYANSYLLLESAGVPTVSDGRITTTTEGKFLVHCYLTRQDSTGTTTGADYIPTQASPGNTLPGSSGDVYLYRGYALRYAEVDDEYELGDALPATNSWVSLLSTTKPDWLDAGVSGKHLQGSEQPKYTVIERATGKYGGTNIDVTVSVNIGGIPITVRSGDLLN
jgi:hypothetical protein